MYFPVSSETLSQNSGFRKFDEGTPTVGSDSGRSGVDNTVCVDVACKCGIQPTTIADCWFALGVLLCIQHDGRLGVRGIVAPIPLA